MVQMSDCRKMETQFIGQIKTHVCYFQLWLTHYLYQRKTVLGHVQPD